MSLETKVKISCQYCSTLLSVPRGYSGKIVCVKCRKELVVNAEIQDVDLIANRLRSIEEAIRGISSALWMIFFFIPLIVTVIWIVIFVLALS